MIQSMTAHVLKGRLRPLRGVGSSVNPLHVPPPVLFTIGYLVGLVVQLLVPFTFTTVLLPVGVYSIGAILFVVGAGFAGWALWIFHNEHTTTVPGEKSAKLVTWGPYRFTRNPMYLGLFLFFAGVSMISDSIWSIPPLLVVVYFLNSTVIVGEERRLRADFGEEYGRYASKVRRWI